MTDSFATSMIFGAVNFVSTFVGIYNVERFGRRNCLFYGAIAMFVFFIIYAALGSLVLYPDGPSGLADQDIGRVMIAVTCLYIFSFACTWAPIGYVYCSEIYPLGVKSKCMALATLGNWVINFLITFFTPFITRAIGFYYGYVFSGCLLLAALFVFFFIPETKGMKLEDIDELFMSGVSARYSNAQGPTESSA